MSVRSIVVIYLLLTAGGYAFAGPNFKFLVERSYHLQGSGTSISGEIKSGQVKVGDTLTVKRSSSLERVVVSKIEILQNKKIVRLRSAHKNTKGHLSLVVQSLAKQKKDKDVHIGRGVFMVDTSKKELVSIKRGDFLIGQGAIVLKGKHIYAKLKMATFREGGSRVPFVKGEIAALFIENSDYGATLVYPTKLVPGKYYSKAVFKMSEVVQVGKLNIPMALRNRGLTLTKSMILTRIK